jgi:flagellar hook-length control protein FliK
MSSGAADRAAASKGDDGFASILGGVMQAPGNDTAKAAKPATQATQDAIPDDDGTDAAANTAGDPAADTTARALQALQEITPSATDAVTPPDGDDAANDPPAVATPSAADVAADATAAVPACDATPPSKDAQPDPTQIAADDATSGKPAKPANDDTAANAATDTILAQMLAMQQAVPVAVPAAAATAVTTPAADTAVQSDSISPTAAASSAAAAVTSAAAAASSVAPAATAATNAAASSMLGGGATTKPAKPGDAKAPADSEKTQAQGSTAAALADSAATRVFTDQRVSSAQALPLHVASDTPKNGNQSGGSPSDQQNSPNTPAPTPTAAPAADPAAVPVSTPAHAQAAPQSDASAAVNTAAATTPTTATTAATPVQAQAATQLQVSHAATAAPDINALAVNIATKSEGGARHFDIRLDPADLGRVDVRLTVDDAGKAQATLSVEKPQTLELLQKDQGHLERALKDAGLDLSQNGLSFSLKGQQQQAGNGGGGASSPRGRALAVQAIAAADTAATNLSLSGVGASDTRLDIRV